MHMSFNRMVAVILLTAMAIVAQANDEPGSCQSEQAAAFDFWLGDWNLTWGEDGATGRNNISKALNGCVIVEQFDGSPGMALKGMSVSTFDRTAQQWKQTWVDNQGSYLDFQGGWDGERMVLSRQANIEGKPAQQRMVWHSITDDAFTWDWERSFDDGETWDQVWRIHYKRATDGTS